MPKQKPKRWRKPRVSNEPYTKGEKIRLKSGELCVVFNPLHSLPDLGVVYALAEGSSAIELGEVWLAKKSEVIERGIK